ncbi:hypothetical protein AB1N83_011002 [Pleurotus pulmonarius]
MDAHLCELEDDLRRVAKLCFVVKLPAQCVYGQTNKASIRRLFPAALMMAGVDTVGRKMGVMACGLIELMLPSPGVDEAVRARLTSAACVFIVFKLWRGRAYFLAGGVLKRYIAGVRVTNLVIMGGSQAARPTKSLLSIQDEFSTLVVFGGRALHSRESCGVTGSGPQEPFEVFPGVVCYTVVNENRGRWLTWSIPQSSSPLL